MREIADMRRHIGVANERIQTQIVNYKAHLVRENEREAQEAATAEKLRKEALALTNKGKNPKKSSRKQIKN